MYSPVFSLCSATFLATSQFHLPKTFYSWTMNCSRYHLQSFRELKFFPLREFCKDQKKWKSECAMSGEYGGWIRTSQPRCNNFCPIIKTCGLVLTWWNIYVFSVELSNWEQYLLELIPLLHYHSQGIPESFYSTKRQ